MDQRCFAGQHLALWVPVGAVCIVVLCLMPPVAVALALWRLHGRLEEHNMQQALGLLYHQYK